MPCDLALAYIAHNRRTRWIRIVGQRFERIAQCIRPDVLQGNAAVATDDPQQHTHTQSVKRTTKLPKNIRTPIIVRWLTQHLLQFVVGAEQQFGRSDAFVEDDAFDQFGIFGQLAHDAAQQRNDRADEP